MVYAIAMILMAGICKFEIKRFGSQLAEVISIEVVDVIVFHSICFGWPSSTQTRTTRLFLCQSARVANKRVEPGVAKMRLWASYGTARRKESSQQLTSRAKQSDRSKQSRFPEIESRQQSARG